MSELYPALQLRKPTVGGEETKNLWGYDLNSNFDKIDAWTGPLPARISALEEADGSVGPPGPQGPVGPVGPIGPPGAVQGPGHIGGLANVSNSRAEAVLTEFGADVKVLQLLGAHKPGDAGSPMPCKRTNGPITIHAGWFRSVDRFKLDGTTDATNGGYWEYLGTNLPIYLEWFGGKADYHIVAQDGSAWGVNPSPTDNRAAFYAAMDFLWVYGAVGGIGVGATIQLGYGAYYMSDELVFEKGFCLQGVAAGYYHDGAGSRLYFAAGKKGIVLNCFAEGTIGTGGTVIGAGGAFIRSVYMECLGFGGQTTKHGIEMNVGSTIEHCSIRGFGGDGINIVADIGIGQNSNCFYINHCVIYNNAGHGVFCQGGDANAGIGTALNIMNNGGWGIYDNSFLGNCWIGCHEAYNLQGPYYLVGGNNRSVVIGCYNEGYLIPSYCGPNAHFIGGTHASGITVERAGSVWLNNAMWPFYLVSQEPGDVLNMRMRGYNQANEIMSVGTPDGGGTWNYNTGTKSFQFLGMYITDNNTTYTGGRPESLYNGKFGFPKGIWLGGDPVSEGAGLRYFGTNRWDHWPGTGYRPGTYAVGDTLINALFSGGSHWADICVQTGAIGPNWSAGVNYAGWADERSSVVKNAGRYYRLVGETLGTETLSVDAPVHTSGSVTGPTDGHTWKYLTGTPALFKPMGTPGLIEAPIDGQTYGRKNGAWVVIPA